MARRKPGVGLPGVPLGQGDVSVAKGLAFAVNGGKICALHAPHQFDPNLRVNDQIEIQTLLGVVVEREATRIWEGRSPAI